MLKLTWNVLEPTPERLERICRLNAGRSASYRNTSAIMQPSIMTKTNLISNVRQAKQRNDRVVNGTTSKIPLQKYII